MKQLLSTVLLTIIFPVYLLGQNVEHHPKSDTLYISTTTVPHYELVKIQTDTVDTLMLYVYDGDNRNAQESFNTPEDSFDKIMVAVQNSNNQYQYAVQYGFSSNDNPKEMSYDSLTAIDHQWAEFQFLIFEDGFVVDSIAYEIDQQFGLSTENNSHPKTFKLHQNYPNPFNPSTMIEFEIQKPAIVSLEIFDLLGKKVEKIIQEKALNTGIYRHTWITNYSIRSGTYLYKLTVDDKSEIKKMSLIK